MRVLQLCSQERETKCHHHAKRKKATVKANGKEPEVKNVSRKSKVRELFDEQGPDAAWTLGAKLGLKQSSLRSWFSTWRRLAKNKPTDMKAAA